MLDQRKDSWVVRLISIKPVGSMWSAAIVYWIKSFVPILKKSTSLVRIDELIQQLLEFRS